jgi:hypothetical protein
VARLPSFRHVGLCAIFGFALFVTLCRPTVAGASERPDGESGTANSTGQSQGTPDFLFGRPKGSIGIRSGWLFARAGSDLFTFVQDRLTIDRKDFNAPALAVDLGIVVAPRTEVLFGFDFSRSSTTSEYRAFVDNNRRPVTQDTRLQQINFSGSLKFALVPRGREVSRYAWIPRTVTPYVGAGGGTLGYELRQEGDFVDFVSLRIFSDTFRSKGWTPSAHVFGGVDIKLWRRLYFTSEARYLWSHARLGRDFSGFQPIDLAGLKMTAGISGVF